MAFEFQKLSVLAYANGFTLWHYATADTADDVTAFGYFDMAAGHLRLGDIILANQNMGGMPSTAIYTVICAARGKVAIADLQGGTP